jgi:hypothetical protein
MHQHSETGPPLSPLHFIFLCCPWLLIARVHAQCLKMMAQGKLFGFSVMIM